jgi:hypothetical protein
MMIATIPEAAVERTEPRTRKVRPAYLDPAAIARAAANGEARLAERMRKQRSE